MGFDNECIVNIQSLAGEYFCPVCRLLVYPNEALQSQCTHLYCKPCLTYIVSTTRACPYDGYLVTEADSKPLTESNKTLAETIGKIAVHCLYNRSGCTWQGSLSECTSHCSGCAFGNSPVVCNRCGIQIVHCQVQEHAQNCPGVQDQVQQAEATQHSSTNSVATSTVQSQTSTLLAAMTTQALTSQTVAATTTGQDLNQLATPTSQTQPLAQTVLQPTAEQWYQQQQCQQYYQQYPGYDPYQQQYQHYYPYQQSVVPQYQQNVQSYSHAQAQSQSQGQPQPQPQSQPQSQGQSQPISHIQALVAPQSQNPMQVNQQQQFQPAVHPPSQIQSLGHPPAHGQALPQPQPYLQAQPHPVKPQPQQQHQVQQPIQHPYPQMQHSQPQVQQTIQKYPVSQTQVQPQLQPHAPVQHLSQPQMHPHQPNQPKIHPHHPSQPLTPIIQPQVQNSSSHAVTGHHPYPQPQPHQNIQLGAPQHHMLMHSQVGPQPQSPHPVQMQNHFPQQTPTMRPHQSHAMFPNQQQLALLASPVQGQSIPTLQQSAYAHSQQPGQINQRPIMRPVQQPLPQQPIVQQQMPMTSHLRPQGPAHSFAEHTHAYPHSQANAALSHNTQHNQSQNAVGMPFVPNHAVPSQPLTQSASAIPVIPAYTGASHLSVNQNMMVGANNQVQLSSELQSRASESVERLSDVSKQNTDTAFGKLGKSVKDLDTISETAIEITSVKSETDVKQIEVGNKQNGEDPESVQTSGTKVNALENGDSVNKNFIKEEAAESAWQPLSGDKSGSSVFGVQNDTVGEHSVVKDKDIQDRTLMKNSSSLEKELPESRSGKLQIDDTCAPQPPASSDNASPAVSQPLGSQGPVDEYRGITPSGQLQSGGFPQPSHPAPYTDEGKNQLINYGPAAVQQRPSEMSASQLPPPGVSNQPFSTGHPSTLLRNHGPAPAHSGQPLNSTDNFLPPMLMQPQGSDIRHGGMPGPGFSTSYGGEPTHRSTPGQSFQPQSLGPPGPYKQGHVSPFHAGSSNFSHVEAVGAPQFGTLPPGDLHGRAPANLPLHAPAGPEGLRRQQRPTNMMVGETYPHQRPSYLDGPQGSGSHYERFTSFPVPGQQNIYQREFEDDLKKFPRPLGAEQASKFRDYSLGPYDRGPHGFSFDSGSKLNPGDGERLVGFHDNAREKSGSTHHPDFIGLGPGYPRHHADGLTPRNPIGEYAEMSSRRLGALSGGLVSKLGTDDFDGRDPRLFGDSVASALHDSQFPHLPSHVRMGEHARSGDFSGQDSFTGHFRGDEHFGPHSFRRHLQLGDPLGFSAPAGHMRTVKLGGNQNFESFSRDNRPDHSRFGALGFRSSFSLPLFPNDGGYFTGNIGSFDNSRKRKAASWGWCRICKVDCETVEGLDLHSQMREHQKMAMDMVKSIKQNVKRQKITAGEKPLVEDGSKSQNTGFEGRGNKLLPC